MILQLIKIAAAFLVFLLVWAGLNLAYNLFCGGVSLFWSTFFMFTGMMVANIMVAD